MQGRMDTPNPGRYTSIGYRNANLLMNVDGMSFSKNYGGDASGDLSRETLVAQSRQFYRDNGLYAGVINRPVSYIVGDGLKLQARSGDDKWNKQCEEVWTDFMRSPDVTGTLDGCQFQNMIVRERFITGDIFGLMVKAPGDDQTRIQLFESEQCIPNYLYHDNGVMLNKYNRPTNYNLVGYETNGMQYAPRTGGTLQNSKFVFHSFNKDRPSSSRGVPILQSVFPMLHRITDICDAEAIARQMLSHLAIAINRSSDTRAGAEAYGGSTADANDSAFRIQEYDYASVFYGGPGESIQGIDRNIPGSNFEANMRMFIRMVGLPVGCPLEVVLLDWTKSNFSQSKAVLQQMFQNFKDHQKELKKVLTFIYVRKINEWITQGRLPLIPTALQHEWITPAFPWLDEDKEIKAQSQKIEYCLSSHSEVCKEMGKEQPEVVAQRRTEIENAIIIANEIEEAHDVKVPWQYFAGLNAQNAHLLEPKPEPETEEPENGSDSDTDDSTGSTAPIDGAEPMDTDSDAD